jgi:hypothetical protein
MCECCSSSCDKVALDVRAPENKVRIICFKLVILQAYCLKFVICIIILFEELNFKVIVFFILVT